MEGVVDVTDLDNPQNVNLFLKRIDRDQVPVPSHASDSSTLISTPDKNIQTLPVHPTVGHARTENFNREAASATARPSLAPKACETTRADPLSTLSGPNQNAAIDGADILRLLADQSNVGLEDSIHAPKNRGRYGQSFRAKPISARKPAPSFVPRRVKRSSDELRGAESENSQDNYKPAPARFTHTETYPPRGPAIKKSQDDRQRASFPSKKEIPGRRPRQAASDNSEDGYEKTVAQYKNLVISTVAARASPVKNERKMELLSPFEGVAIGSSAQDLMKKTSQSTLAASSPEGAALDAIIAARTKKPVLRVTNPDPDAEDVDLTQQPINRPRTVILSNLPVDADLTLVQSLAYGAALELFHLVPIQARAFVTFVTADAAQALHAAHPNGITFKNPTTLRKHTVTLTLGRNPGTISAILQAYLDCDATRVVKAVGVDEHPGIRALYSLARAMNREVESIVDSWRADTRTVLFRFTSITDAVTFKASLVRDADWDGVKIGFGVDPCELAEGVHLEM